MTSSAVILIRDSLVPLRHQAHRHSLDLLHSALLAVEEAPCLRKR